MVGEGIVTLGVWLVTDFRNSKSAFWIAYARRTLQSITNAGGA